MENWSGESEWRIVVEDRSRGSELRMEDQSIGLEWRIGVADWSKGSKWRIRVGDWSRGSKSRMEDLSDRLD